MQQARANHEKGANDLTKGFTMPNVSRGEIAELVKDTDLCTAMANRLTPLIWESTIPILVEQGDVLRQHGTGTLLQIGERSFLVSAGHVYRDAHKHGMALWLGGREGGKGIMRLVGNFHCTAASGDNAGPFDLGIRELDRDIVEYLGNYRYVRLLDVLTDEHCGEDIYCIAGFPTCLATEAKEGEPTANIQKWFCLSYPIKDPCELPNYIDRYHIVLHGKRTDAVAIGDLDDPMPASLAGISGSSIWKTNFAAKPRDSWTPNDAKIVGVQTSVYPKAQAIKGTVWRGVATMIYKVFPELRPVLDLALPR